MYIIKSQPITCLLGGVAVQRRRPQQFAVNTFGPDTCKEQRFSQRLRVVYRPESEPEPDLYNVSKNSYLLYRQREAFRESD